MADPHHVPELDGFDRGTVRLYRAGLSVSALGVAALVAALLLDRGRPAADLTVLVGALLCAANLHLYDKRVRWVIGASAHLASVGWAVAAICPPVVAHWLHHAALGFAFVVLSALALKEQFCFRLPALKLVPLLLAASLLPLVADAPWPAAALLTVAAGVLVTLAAAKLQMPLHVDVGNKAAYQV